MRTWGSAHLIGGALLGGGAALALAGAAQAASDRHTFDIPAQEASKSIPELGRQAGRQIIAPGEQLREVRTPAVHGTLTVDDALSQILRGTHLSVVSDDGQTVILAVQSPPIPPNRGEFETIVVTGYRASLADSTNAKKRSVGFSDTIYAENIGKFPDTNIAEAFNRIPGITISRELDGSGVNVSIRGLGSNFTKVLLNGTQVAVASTGPTNFSNPNREVDLNMFPVELFTQLIVEKSSQADRPEGGAAGTIDMRSARPFDNPGLHLAYSLKGNVLSRQGTVSPSGSLIVSDTIGPFGALLGVTGNTTRFFTTGIESVGWTNPNLLTSGPVVQCAPAAACNTLGGGNWTIPTTVPANVTTGGLVPGEVLNEVRLLALNPGLSLWQLDNMLLPRLGRPFMEKGARSRYNGLLSFEYRPSDDFKFYVDTVGARTSNAFDRVDMNWIIRNGAAIPMGVQVDSNGVVTKGTFANAQWFLEARPYHERGDFLSINSGLAWQASELLHVSLQANASRSHFFRDVPSILVSTAPSGGNGSGVPGLSPPTGGVYVIYSNNGSIPSFDTNIDLDNPENFQWSGGRLNVNAEKRYTHTKGLHFDIQYGGEEVSFKGGWAFDEAYRSILGYDNSQAWQNAVCGNNPNVFVPTPNSQPPCQGLHVAGNAAAVNAVVAGYPSYPGLGTYYSAGGPALAYQGSLIPQSRLASYLMPGPAGFINVNYDKFFQDSHYRDFAYPNALAATGTNLGVASGITDEKSQALYAELNGALPIGDSRLKYNIGIRWVRTMQTVSGPVSQGSALNGQTVGAVLVPLDGGKYPNSISYATKKQSYQAFLPSINAVYEITGRFLVRASVSRTMTRPNPSELLPGINFADQSAAQAVLGNAELKPYFSTNIDIGAELYTDGEGYVGVAAFRKGIAGFTVTQTMQQPFSYLAPFGITYDTLNPTQRDAVNARGGPSAALVNISHVINASGLLTINGMEFNYVQPFDFLLAPYGLEGFGVAANLTLVDQKGSGAAPAMATGISPYTYNLTGYYENKWLSVRLSYVFNDRQVMSGTNQNGICLPNAASKTCPQGAYNYMHAYAQLDLGSSFKLAKLFGDIASDPEITFDVQNLTNSRLRSYFQFPQATFANYSPGTTFIFGLRGSL